MRIGIDIDDTITNTWVCMIPYYSRRFNIPESVLSKSKPYYNAIKHKITVNEYYEYLLPIYDKYIPTVTLKKDVKEVIDKLYNLGHKIYFITARGKDFTNPYELTKEYLDKHHIKYDKIITNALDKAVVCQKEKIDLFIDDSYKHIKNVSKLGIDVIMIDTYYNKEYTEFLKLKDWNEIYEYIKSR